VQAIDSSRAASLLSRTASLVKKGDNVQAAEDKRPVTGHGFQPVFMPMTHGPRRCADGRRRLLNIISPESSDPSSAVASVGHRSLPQAGDERADVFDPPDRRSWTKFDGLRKPPRFDASPPGRPTHRDRSVWSEDGRETEKSCLGNMIICVQPYADAIARSSHGPTFLAIILDEPATQTVFDCDCGAG
jgi:hypothetical protein